MAMITNKIILNERQYAEDLIARKWIGGNSTQQKHSINIVAKYYANNELFDEVVEDKLRVYIAGCIKNDDLTAWNNQIEKAIENSRNSTLQELPGIPITQKELDIISSCNLANRGKRISTLSRVLFAMLSIAKYHNMLSPNNNNWVPREPWEIFSFACVDKPTEKQGIVFRLLRENGYISRPQTVSNTHRRVEFVDNEGDAVLLVTNFCNLGWQYEQYINPNGFIKCQVCGVTEKRKCNRQKVCKKCS